MDSTTITLPTELLRRILAPELQVLTADLEAYLAVYFATLPQPDPQYTVAQVAETLSLTEETIRGYMKLAVSDPRHPRHLPFVDTTGQPRGFRVLLSDLTAWQQRNRFPEEFILPPKPRPTQHK